MDAKRCIVTGASSGIGMATALGLAERGCDVVMVCRDVQRGERALRGIRQRSGSDHVQLMIADLSSQGSIRALASGLIELDGHIDVLVNNAGVLRDRRLVTEDGLETTFAVNHLAPFLLTHLLLDALIAAAPARVVNVASDVHRGGHIDFDDLQSERGYSGWHAYRSSKLANVLFTREFARRLKASGVTANTLHPGYVDTRLFDHGAGLRARTLRVIRSLARRGRLRRVAGIDPREGARTSIHLALSADVEGVSGGYFADAVLVEPSAEARDPALATRLWDVSAALVGVDS